MIFQITYLNGVNVVMLLFFNMQQQPCLCPRQTMLEQFERESMKEKMHYEDRDNGSLFSSTTSYADRTHPAPQNLSLV